MSSVCTYKLQYQGCQLRYYGIEGDGREVEQKLDIALSTELQLLADFKDNRLEVKTKHGLRLARVSFKTLMITEFDGSAETPLSFDSFTAFLADIRARQASCGCPCNSQAKVSSITPTFNLGLWVHNDGDDNLTNILSTSGDPNNLLDIGSDGGSFIGGSTLGNFISQNPNNYLVQGTDDKLFVNTLYTLDGNLTSNREIELGTFTFGLAQGGTPLFLLDHNAAPSGGAQLNISALLVDPTGLELTGVASNPGNTAADTLWLNSSNGHLYRGAVDLELTVSADSNNLIAVGGDLGALLLATNLISTDPNNSLSVGADFKLHVDDSVVGLTKYVHEFTAGDWSSLNGNDTLTITAGQHGKSTNRLSIEVYEDLGATSKKVIACDTYVTDMTGDVTLSIPTGFPGGFTGFAIII